MQIIIIAGGSGRRMQPLVTHKTIFPFLGTPILEYALRNSQIFQATKTLIVAHPSATADIEPLANKYSAQVVVQNEALGMADAVLCAKNYLDPDQPILIMDAVTIQEKQNFEVIAQAIKNMPESILSPGLKVDHYKHGGYYVFDQNNNAIKIIEKPGADNMPSSYFKLVLDYFPKSSILITALEQSSSNEDDVYEVSISNLMGSSSIEMVEVKGSHASLKHAPRVLDVMNVLLNHYLVPNVDPSAKIATNATIEGDVQIGKNVRIFENAVIKGPVYIGDNSVIGNGALVRESCIESDCEIGYNSEIARSYIGPNTKCHTTYVGDSIIEGNSNLAAGTITANLRFDDRSIMVNLPSGRIDTGRHKFGAILALGVKTGIHTSLMPGAVVPSYTVYSTPQSANS